MPGDDRSADDRQPAPANPAELQPVGVKPAGVLLTLCWSLVIIGVNTTGINTAIGVVAEDFSMSTSMVAWTINAYLLAAATTVAAGGQFGDVLGRRRMFSIGLVLFAAGSTTLALAPEPWVLVVGRGLQGSASGLMLPAQLALVRLVYPAARQGTAVGIWAATASFTFAVGPLYGGAFADSVGWRWLFAFDLVLLAGAGILAVVFLRPVREWTTGARPDIWGAVALGVATVSLIVALQQGSSWGWTSAAVLGTLGLAVVAAVLFVLAERRVADPLVHFSLFREAPYVAGVVTTFAQGFGLMGLLYFVSIFVESAGTYDLSALDAGLVLFPSGLAMFLAALLGGRWADRVGFRVPNSLAMLVGGVGAGLLAMLTTSDTSAFTLAFVACVLGAGVGVGFSTTSAAGMAAVPPHVSGEAAGVINMARYVGTVMVVSIGTVLYTGVAQSDLDSKLSTDDVPTADQLGVENAMAQSADDLDKALESVPSADRSEALRAVQDSTVKGFSTAQLLVAGVLLVAAVASWFLLAPSRPNG